MEWPSGMNCELRSVNFGKQTNKKPPLSSTMLTLGWSPWGYFGMWPENGPLWGHMGVQAPSPLLGEKFPAFFYPVVVQVRRCLVLSVREQRVFSNRQCSDLHEETEAWPSETLCSWDYSWVSRQSESINPLTFQLRCLSHSMMCVKEERKPGASNISWPRPSLPLDSALHESLLFVCLLCTLVLFFKAEKQS